MDWDESPEGAHTCHEQGSVTDRTAGIFRSAGPALTAEELREAAEWAIAYEVQRRSSARP